MAMNDAAHGAGFVASGLIAFATDAAALAALTRGFGADPFLARIAAIGVAIVAGYFAHRKLTFAVAEAPSMAEFVKFVSVAAAAAALNFAIYAGALFAFPRIEPLLALVASSGLTMAASYLGYRFGVFRKPD